MRQNVEDAKARFKEAFAQAHFASVLFISARQPAEVCSAMPDVDRGRVLEELQHLFGTREVALVEDGESLDANEFQGLIRPHLLLIRTFIALGACVFLERRAAHLIHQVLPESVGTPCLGHPATWSLPSRIRTVHSVLARMLPGFMSEEDFAKTTKLPGLPPALDLAAPPSMPAAQSTPIPLLTSQQICQELSQVPGQLDAVEQAHRYMLSERNFRERLARTDTALLLRVKPATPRIDRRESVDESFAQWCFSLGFSFSDIIILHRQPTGTADVAKVLGLPAKSVSSGKDVAEISTEDLHRLVETVGDVERLVCVFYKKRPMPPADFHLWKDFLVEVGKGAAGAESAPTAQLRKRGCGDMQIEK